MNRRQLTGCIITAMVAAACAPSAAPSPTAAPPSKSAGSASPTQPTATTATKPAPPAATPAPSNATAPAKVTVDVNALQAAAKQEGKVVWYTSVELKAAQAMGKAFETKYGVPVEVVRSGSEALFRRYMQEQSSGIHAADVIQTSNDYDYVDMKEKQLLQPFRPSNVTSFNQKYRDRLVDKDDMFFVARMGVLNAAYNPKVIPAADAPKTWEEMIQPRFAGKIVLPHPLYATAVVQTMDFLVGKHGWGYFENLAKLDPLVVQAANDATARAVSGERGLAFALFDYSIWQLRATGADIVAIYPPEGVPFVAAPQAILAKAPHPNAAKLFQEWTFTQEAQQLMVDELKAISTRDDVKYTDNRPALAALNLVFPDPVKLQQNRQQYQDRFQDIFGV